MIKFSGSYANICKSQNVIYLQFDGQMIVKFDMTGTKVVALPGNNNNITSYKGTRDHCTCKPRAKTL